jgi:two-component system, OmpR family, copper resistance phosphate regulon response regulator CusR
MKAKILIVDDDEEICEELSETLKGKGYQVEAAFDGMRAIQMIFRTEYALILLDLKLPSLSGFEVLKLTRQKNIKTKILILTGRPLLKKKEPLKEPTIQDEDEERTLKLADGIINKPFDINYLLNKIKDLLT